MGGSIMPPPNGSGMGGMPPPNGMGMHIPHTSGPSNNLGMMQFSGPSAPGGGVVFKGTGTPDFGKGFTAPMGTGHSH